MAKTHFTPSMLDKLVDESIADADQLTDELRNVDLTSDEFGIENLNNEDDYLTENDIAWSENKHIVDHSSEGGKISYDYVYKKIGQLIDHGNAALQVLESIDPDVTNPATLGATASLLNSIRGCISEFTKIHQQYIKFTQMIELEKLRHKNKKDIIVFRRKVNNGQLEEEEATPTELIETSSTQMIDFLNFQKAQKEAEEKKNEKV